MKFLRFLIILVVLVIAAVCILGLVEPNDITVQRSITINAPKTMVFDQIVKFKNWTNWSPWYQKDPTAKMTYMGEDGQAGSGYHWEGDDKKTGSGEMKSSAVKDGQMDYTLHFEKPMKGDATGFFTVADTAGQSRVTWSTTMHCGFPWNAMMAFMDMDKKMGPDFDSGLYNMKKYVESKAKVDIAETQFPGHIYAGIRKTVSVPEMGAFFMDAYSNLAKEAQGRITGNPASLTFKWDNATQSGDIAAVFPVGDSSKPIKGATFFNVPASKAFMAVHKGGYSTIGAEHRALMKYAENKGVKADLMVEDYMVGPGQEKDSTKWVTNIYHLVH